MQRKRSLANGDFIVEGNAIEMSSDSSSAQNTSRKKQNKVKTQTQPESVIGEEENSQQAANKASQDEISHGPSTMVLVDVYPTFGAANNTGMSDIPLTEYLKFLSKPSSTMLGVGPSQVFTPNDPLSIAST